MTKRTTISWRERVMGRDPRIFRGAKESGGIHGHFAARISHGAGSIIESRVVRLIQQRLKAFAV
jgi:hypothetical protein